jgi:hypothetical protein
MYATPIEAEDSRGSLTGVMSECIRLSLEKWKLEECSILCNMDGLSCSINCPEIMWGSTAAGWHQHPHQLVELGYLD